MNLKELPTPTKQATLCFITRDDEVLLGMKKRGFATDKWNGFGGKPDDGEKILDTAIREVQEEAEVTPNSLVQMGVLDMHHSGWSQQVVVYSTTQWEGTPVETEEMRPKWFSMDEIPYDEMWIDAKTWLPPILDGKKVKGCFLFGEKDKLLDQEIEIVKNFE